MAQKLQLRLAQIEAASSLSELAILGPPSPRVHQMSGDRAGKISVDLEYPYRLYFIPANDPIPKKADGGLDWDAVTEIEIVEIDDPHGKKRAKR